MAKCLLSLKKKKRMLIKLKLNTDYLTVKLKGVPTKSEIIALTLFKLELKKDDILLDIGCGSGNVSIEASKYVNKIFAIDKRKEAIDLSKENIEIKGKKNISLIEGEAIEVIPKITNYNKAFVGGTGGHLEDILNLIKGSDKIVVNASRIEVASRAKPEELCPRLS